MTQVLVKGNKRLIPSDRRETIIFRTSPEQKEALVKIAEDSGKGISDVLRIASDDFILLFGNDESAEELLNECNDYRAEFDELSHKIKQQEKQIEKLKSEIKNSDIIPSDEFGMIRKYLENKYVLQKFISEIHHRYFENNEKELIELLTEIRSEALQFQSSEELKEAIAKL